MKKTVVIIVIGALVLIAVLWGASHHFGWVEGKTLAENSEDSFVYVRFNIDKYNDKVNIKRKTVKIFEKPLEKLFPGDSSSICQMEFGFPWEEVEACINNDAEVLESVCPKCGHHKKKIFFRSPHQKWERLCGRAGWLTICDHCELQFEFGCVLMN